jgi:hypothetical protein
VSREQIITTKRRIKMIRTTLQGSDYKVGDEVLGSKVLKVVHTYSKSISLDESCCFGGTSGMTTFTDLELAGEVDAKGMRIA